MTTLDRRSFCIAIGGAALAFAPGLAHAETTLEKIKRTGKVTVGTEASFAPFEFVKDGKIVGYGKDILTEVVAALGVELEQLDLPWQGILPGLLAGKFDFVATSVGLNEERARKYAYTMPIAESTPHAMKRKGDTRIAKLSDLNGRIVATQLASSTEPVARDLDARLKAEGGAGLKELKLYTSFPETYVALASREVDVVVQSLPSLAVLMKERPGVFELVGPIASGTTYLAWVTRPEDRDLRDFISGIIRKLRDDGKLFELQDKWFGFRMTIPDAGYLPPGAV